jgi:hypothetical protein
MNAFRFGYIFPNKKKTEMASPKEYVLILSNFLERLRDVLVETLPENATEINEDLYDMYDSDSSSSSSTSSSSSGSSSGSSGSSSGSSSLTPLVYTEARQEEFLQEAARALLSKNLLSKSLRQIHTSNSKVMKARKKLLKIVFREMAYDVERSASGQFFLDEEDEAYDTGKEVAEAIVDEFLSDEWLQKLVRKHSFKSIIDETEIDM